MLILLAGPDILGLCVSFSGFIDHCSVWSAYVKMQQVEVLTKMVYGFHNANS